MAVDLLFEKAVYDGSHVIYEVRVRIEPATRRTLRLALLIQHNDGRKLLNLAAKALERCSIIVAQNND